MEKEFDLTQLAQYDGQDGRLMLRSMALSMMLLQCLLGKVVSTTGIQLVTTSVL